MQTIKHSADTHPDRKAGRQGLIDTVKELASATTHMARAARRVASTSVSTDAKKGVSRNDIEKDGSRVIENGDIEKCGSIDTEKGGSILPACVFYTYIYVCTHAGTKLY